MSEMKCPVCGNNMRLSEYDVWRRGTCTFSCATCDIDRISAAMDLARCVADSRIDWNEDTKWLYVETRKVRKKAMEKVMEAFK